MIYCPTTNKEFKTHCMNHICVDRLIEQEGLIATDDRLPLAERTEALERAKGHVNAEKQ